MVLKVENLSTSFQTSRGRFKAVNNISFDLESGESLGIVGESGCGKSVAALSILRLIQQPAGRIDSGRIYFKGQNLLDLSLSKMRKIRGKSISMIFQEPMTSLNPVFSIGDQIQEAILLHQPLTRRQARKRCLEMMEMVGIPRPEERLNFYPHQLSGGLRQRVMIAMALACEPEILLADEPTTALDVTIQSQILELIKDLQRKLNMSLIMITHDFGVIAEIADRVLVMYAGKIVEEAKVDKIFDSPEHPYTRALQQAIPSYEKRGKVLYSIPFSVPGIDEQVDLESRWKELDQDLKRAENMKTWPETQLSDHILLQVRELQVSYPIKSGILGRNKGEIKAVDKVSFEVKKGEILGLVGESGCGKSTLGKSLLHLVSPSGGQIFYKGQDISHIKGEELRRLRKDIQIIFQDPYSSLNPRMRIGEILSEPFIIHKLCPAKERRERVLKLLDTVGLRKEAYDKFPHEFSGGQRQRIGIARALAVRPEFLVADEPVSALDVSIQAQILNLLRELKDEFQLTYLFISHDLNVVQYLCDRILVMNQGRIVEELLPNDIPDPNRKKDIYTETLISAIPKRHPSESRLR